MTASCIPRNYYLLVHDALRKIVGTEATLAAFVKHKHQFQCDMLVNSKMTDIEGLRSISSATSHPLLMQNKADNAMPFRQPNVRESRKSCNYSSNTYNKNSKAVNASVDVTDDTTCTTSGDDDDEQDHRRVMTLYNFANALQKELPLCVIIPHTRRLDITFSDYNVIQLALGADLQDIGHLQSAAEINEEHNWWKRNRLRISLGFDEELFIEHCQSMVRKSAIMIDRVTRAKYERETHEALESEECRSELEKYGNNYNVIIPPFTYWLVHCYCANLSYQPLSPEKLTEVIYQNYKKYYGIFALDNPYCPGEDLNSMNVARWLCDPERREYKLDATSILPILEANS